MFFFFLSEYSYLVNTSSVSQFNDIIDVYQFFSFFVIVKWQNIYSFSSTSISCKYKAFALCWLFLSHCIAYRYQKKKKKKKKERRFRGIKLEWGYDKVIPLKTFKDASNEYLVDDTCVFGVEVFDGKQRSMDKGECLQLIKDFITNEYQWIVRATLSWPKNTMTQIHSMLEIINGTYLWIMISFLGFSWPL